MTEQTTTLNKSSITEQLGYYVAPETYKALMLAKQKVIKRNQDRVYIIDGREGMGGKSTLAMQLGGVVDQDITVDQIVFNSKELAKLLRSSEKYKAVIFDEAFNGLSSKGVLSKENKLLIRLFQECRQQNLFIFICLPTIFLLEKYIGIFRSQALFHTFESRKDAGRKYYKVYNYSKKKILFLKGKQLMSYYTPKIEKTSRFYAKVPKSIDYEAYIKKKRQSFRDNEDTPKEEDSKKVRQRSVLSKILKDKYGLSYAKQAEELKDNDCHVSSTILSRYAGNVPQKVHNT